MLTTRHVTSGLARISLLVALAMGLTGRGAAAQAISTVSPDQGSIGTVLTISGSGFGTGRPKVFLVFGDESNAAAPKFRLSVLSSADSEIHAAIAKAVVGACSLHVV